MSELMLAFIMPNEPKTDDEKAAFEKAVVYQIEHEKTLEEQLGNETLPQGITSFAIGHFSATLDSSYQQPYLTRKNICPFAYSALLRAGLLYHGM